jgi:hypothetical protein
MRFRTRSHRIEYELFRFFFSGSFSERKRSAFIGNLVQFVVLTVPDCRDTEVVNALKRLHPRYLKLDKWEDVPAQRFRSYDEYAGNDGEFFYRGDIRMELTEHGQPYFEALSNQFLLDANEEPASA